MTWRIWSRVGSTSSSNASFETSFSSEPPLLWTRSGTHAAFSMPVFRQWHGKQIPWRLSNAQGSPPWSSDWMWSTSTERRSPQTLQIGSRDSTARRVVCHLFRLKTPLVAWRRRALRSRS